MLTTFQQMCERQRNLERSRTSLTSKRKIVEDDEVVIDSQSNNLDKVQVIKPSRYRVQIKHNLVSVQRSTINKVASPKNESPKSDSSKKTDLATILMFEESNLNSSIRSNDKFARAIKSVASLEKTRPKTSAKEDYLY
jgi:hypothetical protein